MAAIIHLLTLLLLAILRGFAAAFVFLLSRAFLALIVVSGLTFIVLALTGTLGLSLFRRS